MQDLAHEPGDRGLAGAWVAQEHAMQRWRLRFVAKAGAFALDGQHVDQLADFCLDRSQADHAVQLGQSTVQRTRTARDRGDGRGRGGLVPVLAP